MHGLRGRRRGGAAGLTLEDYRGAEPLPRLCGRCGRPARGRRWVRLPGGSSGLGLFLGVATGHALDNLEQMLTGKGASTCPSAGGTAGSSPRASR
jgi:hypothetical protein